MSTDRPDTYVAFSRYLSPAAAAAPGAAISFAVVLFVLGHDILRIAGDEAPLALGVAALLYLPVIVCLAAGAGGQPAGAEPYELARAGGSTHRAFAAGWLMLGSLAPLAAALVQALVQRLGAVLERLFGLEVATPWLVVAVVPLIGLQALLADAARWQVRTALVWGGAAVLAGLIAWAFYHQPPSHGALPPRQPLGHWLSSVAVLAAGLWSLEPILHLRPQLRRGDRMLVPAALAAWLPALATGAAASVLVLRFPDLLAANWLARLTWSEHRLELLSLITAIVFCAAALYWLLASTMRLLSGMTRDGFLPGGLLPEGGDPEGGQRNLLPAGSGAGQPGSGLAPFLAGVALLALSAGPLTLAGAASLGLLATVAIVILPQIRRRRATAASARKLPLHPLLPVIAVAVAVFCCAVLPVSTLQGGAVWGLLGGLYFLTYARRHALEARRRELVVGETAMMGLAVGPQPESETGYRVLAWAGDRVDLAPLVAVGGALARARGGELLMLAVVPLLERRPMSELRDAAEAEWLGLNRHLGRARRAGAPIRTLVRVAPSAADAILETAAEYRADFLLLAGAAAETEARAPVLAPVFSATSRPLAVLRGRPSEQAGRVVAVSSGGPHAAAALELADALAAAGNEEGDASELALLAIATPQRSAATAFQAAARTAGEAELSAPVEPTVTEARDAAEGILREVASDDVLVLGASIDPLLGQAVLGGFGADLAEARDGATIVVKRREPARRFWLRRLWQAARGRLPTLEVSERAEVFSQLRHQARASIDYYVQMFLASAIAVLGLRLDSSAVIIGAMLVAPLMSPILGVAHGIVQGNLHLIHRAGASTLKGVGVAIAVGIATALLLPARLPTHEMLARGHPSLLDLLVALAAGAAAAYAMSRKSVAAALPGVAISVALVPPLCVAGHAIGASDFRLAGGALLLFLTNLAGIVLIGSSVFLLLGFRPSRSRRGRRVGRGMLLALATTLLLAVPLGLETVRMTRAGHVEAWIDESLRQAAAGGRFRVPEYSIERRGPGFLVVATIYDDGELSMEGLEEVRRGLSAAAGVPVELHVTLVEARVFETGGEAEALDAPGAAAE